MNSPKERYILNADIIPNLEDIRNADMEELCAIEYKINMEGESMATDENEIKKLMRKMVFFNVGWMNKYEGLDNRDIIKNGGAWVEEHGWGHEICNFKPQNGYYYGFVETKWRNGKRNTLHIERIDPNIGKDVDKVDEVLVIWTAKDDNNGQVIVGWYKNATVYREPKERPRPNECETKETGPLYYFAKARVEDGYLLPVEKRIFKMKRKEGFFGQANVWYADRNSPEVIKFGEDVVRYILDYESFHKKRNPLVPLDHEKIERVERIAVDMTIKYFENEGYTVKSVERDNKGWDLEAEKDGNVFYIEVKGLSGNMLNAELTPNEYDKMNLFKDRYCISIVTDALGDNPKHWVFRYDQNKGMWIDKDGNPLYIKERKAAILFL